MREEEWRRSFTLLGSDAEDDLTKLLLQDLATELETTPLELYRTYLKSTLSLTLNHGNLATLKDPLLKKFYGAQHRKAEALYLSLRNPTSLAKLGQILGLNLALVRPPTIFSSYTKLTDRSVYSMVAQEERPLRLYLLCLDKKTKKHWELYKSITGEAVHRDECEDYIIARSAPKVGCLIERLADLLGLKEECYHEHGESCSSVTGLVSNRTLVHAMLKKTDFILASHLGNSSLTKNRNDKPKAQVFGQLAFFRENDLALSRNMETVPVICLTPSGRLYLPHEPYAMQVRYPASSGRTRHPNTTRFPDMDQTAAAKDSGGGGGEQDGQKEQNKTLEKGMKGEMMMNYINNNNNLNIPFLRFKHVAQRATRRIQCMGPTCRARKVDNGSTGPSWGRSTI